MAKLTVLQLDTAFPRLPGDVASPDSYDCAIDIVTIPAATVKTIVTDHPDHIDISGFEAAIDLIDRTADDNDVITTSCGFFMLLAGTSCLSHAPSLCCFGFG